jgi:hypothetical protein
VLSSSRQGSADRSVETPLVTSVSTWAILLP